MCRSRRNAIAFQPHPQSSTTTSSSSTTISSLPVPAILYSPADISSAILNPHSTPLSPSSFRCSLHSRDVFIHRRRFRTDPSTLPSRIADTCRIHHRNLIRLLGASLSADSIFLIYEFAPGASLSACLRNPAFTPLSSWLSRIQIAADLAQGLDYIHHHTAQFGSVHNRINSSAVIVSEPGLRARICHLGAAFLAGDIEDSGRSVRIEGTRGYLAPEVMAGGTVSGKSDVFAFGVVLLELMSGEEAVKCRLREKRCEWVSVIETARGAVGSGVRLWVDRRLKDSFPLEVVEKMVVVALRCVEEDVGKRPTMSWVQGKISQLFLESKDWSERIRVPLDISATFGPR